MSARSAWLSVDNAAQFAIKAPSSKEYYNSKRGMTTRQRREQQTRARMVAVMQKMRSAGRIQGTDAEFKKLARTLPMERVHYYITHAR